MVGWVLAICCSVDNVSDEFIDGGIEFEGCVHSFVLMCFKFYHLIQGLDPKAEAFVLVSMCVKVFYFWGK